MRSAAENHFWRISLYLFFVGHSGEAAVNIASGRNVEHNKNFEDNTNKFGASYAVDGCISPFSETCCSHTRDGQKTSWWRVDLGQRSTIDHIVIHYRPGFANRFAGYELYVSNNTDRTHGVLCYRDTSSSVEDVNLNPNHQCQAVGQFVIIFNERKNSKRHDWYYDNAVLELCEVQVYGCSVGFYGSDNCNTGCPSTCRGNCASTSGFCFYCDAGKYGDFCLQNCSKNCKDVCTKDAGECLECISGKYGVTCDQDCSIHCVDRVCNGTSGYCFQCISGKYGVTCDEDCPIHCVGRVCNGTSGYCFNCTEGKYGNKCTENCSASCQDNTCEKDNGRCFECIPGKYGAKCDQDCPLHCDDSVCNRTTGYCFRCVPGKYGNVCGKNCSANCEGKICTKDEGLCTACVSGYYGSECNNKCLPNCTKCTQDNGNCTECIPGTFGSRCESPCSQFCYDNSCNSSNGHCMGCKDGYHGDMCTLPCEQNCEICQQNDGTCKECSFGLYGQNCSLKCGNCQTCEIGTGHCTSVCLSGWTGTTCEEALPVITPSDNTGVIAGATGAVLFAIVIGVIALIVLRRRSRAKAPKQKPFQHTEISTTKRIHSDDFDELPMENPIEQGSVYINAGMVGKQSENVYYNSGSFGTAVGDLKSVVATKMKNKAKIFEDEYKTLPTGHVHAHDLGKSPQNVPKNRFKSTFPYDHSRVVLERLGKDPYSDYINANYIDSVTKEQEYIATQGPRPDTVDDFWRMVWQLKSGKIVMLTNLIEAGKHKCAKYWPDEGESLTTTHFNVILDRERKYAFYVVRDIVITETKLKSVRKVHQFHFTIWPDHGTPDPDKLVVFHRRVKNYTTTLPGKMVVHCSAGIGRTGTFLALDALLDYGREYGRVNVLEYIKTMRKDSVNMVQTNDQYIAIHHCLIEAFDMPDTLISSANFLSSLNTLSKGGATNQTNLRKEFQLTRSLKPAYSDEDYRTALLPRNKNKNKTLSILAADKYRVYLRSHTNGRTDYINSVSVPSYTNGTGYILTQRPLPDTVVDLWTMVMDHKCENIVIIGNKDIEWLPDEGKTGKVHDFTITRNIKASTISDVDISDICMTNEANNFSSHVRVFHLTNWDQDSVVPGDSSCILQLLELVDSRRRSDDSKPAVVMCNDGCTLSGLFCCLSNAKDQMKIDNEVDIFQVVRQIIIRRPECMSNFEQYQYCYQIIKEYLDTIDVYVN